MSGVRNIFVLSLLTTLILAVFSVPSVQAERGDSHELVAGDFGSCCNSLKSDLRDCEAFKDDPPAYSVCRTAAFSKFTDCVDDLLDGIGVSPLDEAMASLLPACPVQLPL